MKFKFFPILILFLFSASSVQAFVRAQFFGMQTMLNIVGQNALGPTDSDPLDLFNRMNVPIQHSFLGPGKAIVSEDKIFNFVCSLQGNEYKCSIIIKASPATVANPLTKTLIYDITGDAAKKLTDKFYLNAHQVVHFVSADQQLTLDATNNHFRLYFQGISRY